MKIIVDHEYFAYTFRENEIVFQHFEGHRFYRKYIVKQYTRTERPEPTDPSRDHRAQ
jgi:hypothetical protein